MIQVSHLLQEVPLPAPLGVPDGGGVGGLRDEQVGPALVDPGRAQVAVGGHVVVAGVHHALGTKHAWKCDQGESIWESALTPSFDSLTV